MSIIENPNEALVSQNQTILMVDDTPTNLAVVGDYLTQQGYRVMVALTGETGVNVAKEAHPDLILLDVRLPGIDGFETCRRLKADEQTRDIPVIFMTIVTRTEDKVRGFEAGGVDYITKPFQHEEVLARVTTHLRIRELAQKLEEAKESLELRVVERTSVLAQTNVRLKEEIAERKKSEEALQRLNRELRAISNCNQVLMRSVDEQTLLDDICRIVCDEAGYHMAWVGYAENDEAKTVRPVAWAGNETGYLANANITWADTERGRGPSGTAIRHGESICIQDFTTDSQVVPWRENALQRGYRSSIALPLKDESARTFGALTIYSTEPDAFTPDEIRLLEELAGDLAFGIVVLRARTERKWAEEALGESEEKYRTLIQKIQAAVIVHGSDTRILTANALAQELLGLTEEQMLGKMAVDSAWHFFLEAGTPMRLEQYPVNQVLESGSALRNFILRVHRPNKENDVWVLVNADPVFSKEDEIDQVIVTFIDITKRKQVEEDLRASETRFRTFVDHAADAFFVHENEDGTILDVNRQTCESLGYRREELIGMTPPDFDLNASPELLMQLQARLRAGEVVAFDTYHRRKDGTTFPVEVRLRPFWQGDKRLSVSLVRDISERQRAELEREQLLQQIRQQAKEVQFIVDTVPEGMFLLSENGHVRLANAIAEQYLAFLASGWETDPLTRLGQCPLVDLLTSPPKGLWHDVVMGERLFEVIARPVENGPTNEGWVFVIRDVTREREIQQHLQAHERLAAVGQLAAGIAHDFNNTLAVIKLYTELLLRTLELPPRAAERLHILEQQTQRASDLIQQILDFSRQSVMERQSLNLLPFLKELLRLLQRTLPESIDIELDYAQDAYVIHADPSRIQQAIMNLAVNARDAMAEGGHLLIGLNGVRLEPGALPPVPGMGPGEWIRVSIADSGTGIPAEAVVHIFEPFFTTKERGQGTGLGLAQVYGIVQQHDGFIRVTTEVGRGTTFQLYFPAFAVDWQAIPKPPAAALPQGQRQVVLVVEDEEAMRQALVESLALLNYSVREARNGREALFVLAQHSHEIALVLSDAVMPEMGGVALFHALREQELAIPFVIVTGHAIEKDMENLRALGLYGWLKKPLELSKLAELLAQGLS